LFTTLSVVLAGTVLAACTGYSGTLAHQVDEWASGASLTTNDGYVTSDISSIAVGIKQHQLTATHTACDGLGSDAGTADGELPTPDTRLTDDLNDAYLDFTKAAQDCSNAKSFGAGFAPYERELAEGKKAYAAAMHRLKVIRHS